MRLSAGPPAAAPPPPANNPPIPADVQFHLRGRRDVNVATAIDQEIARIQQSRVAGYEHRAGHFAADESIHYVVSRSEYRYIRTAIGNVLRADPRLPSRRRIILKIDVHIIVDPPGILDPANLTQVPHCTNGQLYRRARSRYRSAIHA